MRDNYVRVIVRSPVLDPPEKPAYGSGLLITEDGHVLTSAHVVRKALYDQLSTGEWPRRTGASVTVQFLVDASTFEELEFETDILNLDLSTDVALLKIASWGPTQHTLPTLDYESGYIQGGITVLGFGQETVAGPGQPQSPARLRSMNGWSAEVVQNNFKRVFNVNLAPGFSGAPVFYRGLDKWYLVGIVTGGDDKYRSILSFVTVLDGARTVLDGVSELFYVREMSNFPSNSFSQWAGIDVCSIDPDPERSWVANRIVDTVTASAFAQRILTERLGEPTDENIGYTSCMRSILEAALELTLKRADGAERLRILRTLTDKLISIHEKLGVDSRQTVTKWREYLKLLWDYCGSDVGDTSAKTRCWFLVVHRHELVWRDKVREGWARARGENRVGWARVAVDQLFEWGNATERLLKDSRKDILASQTEAANALAWVKRERRPTRQVGDPIELTMLAAATEKYLEAYGVLKTINRSGTDSAMTLVRERSPRVCQGIYDTTTRLRQEGHAIGANAYVAWAGNMRNLTPLCERWNPQRVSN